MGLDFIGVVVFYVINVGKFQGIVYYVYIGVKIIFECGCILFVEMFDVFVVIGFIYSVFFFVFQCFDDL